MKEFDRDIRIASSKLKAPCSEIEAYKRRYNINFADTPESLDKLCVSLWGYKYETLKMRTNYAL